MYFILLTIHNCKIIPISVTTHPRHYSLSTTNLHTLTLLTDLNLKVELFGDKIQKHFSGLKFGA